MHYRPSFFLFFSLLIFSCSDSEQNKSSQSSPRIKSQTSVLSPKNGSIYTIGASIDIAFNNDQAVQIDSILIQDQQKNKKTYTTKSFTYKTESLSVGRNNLLATVFLSNGNKERKSISVILKSDIEPKQYTYRVIEQYPHDTQAFTQGLMIEDGVMYESTGGSHSSIRKTDMTTGEVLINTPLDSRYFGEGITAYQDKMYMLTWQSRQGLIFDKNTLTYQSTFNYPTEGWGMTNLSDTLVMSDGTESLYFMEPEGFTEVKRIEVYDQSGKIDSLNELEYIKGSIYANVWISDSIYIIDPNTGKVTGVIDLAGLIDKTKFNDNIDVLNGIAYDKESDRLFVTGKNWPYLFEIELIEALNNN